MILPDAPIARREVRRAMPGLRHQLATVKRWP